MICAWNELLSILPEWMRASVDKQGRNELQELRLRLGKQPELVMGKDWQRLNRCITTEDLKFCVNTASRYSPWSAETVSQGFITASGGHRIGLCGEAVIDGNMVRGIRNLSSLCIRVARDFPGIGTALCADKRSMLIIGSPGSGKTTLLRDLIRQISNGGCGSVSVVDERGELFPQSNGKSCFDSGSRTDVISGCSKTHGIEMVLRTMGPATIAVDEITAECDCDALIRAGWCGVRLIATAHAADISDLCNRPMYRKLWKSGLFDCVLVLQKDKTWTLERIVK